MSRRRHSTMLVHVEVDEVLDELSDDDLRQICEERGISVPAKTKAAPATPGSLELLDDFEALCDDIRDAARSGDRSHLDVLLLRMGDLCRVPRLAIPDGRARKDSEAMQ